MDIDKELDQIWNVIQRIATQMEQITDNQKQISLTLKHLMEEEWKRL